MIRLRRRDVLMTWSDDEGRTWAKPRDLTAAVTLPNWTWVATGPGVGIQLMVEPYAGRLVIPCDHRDEQPVNDDSRNRCFSHVMYSDDHGLTWQLGGITEAGSYECQVIELSGGRLMLNGRMQQKSQGYRGVSLSEDGGMTWSSIRHDEELPEPICQAALIRAPLIDVPGSGQSDGWLFSNPAVRKVSGIDKNKQRRRLAVKLSQDEGETWEHEKVLYAGPAAYSSLAVLDDGLIACLYEAGEVNWRSGIYFARFSRDWLLQGESDEGAE